MKMEIIEIIAKYKKSVVGIVMDKESSYKKRIYKNTK